MSYPKTLVHPSYAPAVVAVPLSMDELKAGKVPEPAAPARYPPVTVHGEDQERLERSRGYREPGEPELGTQHHEYPLWLVHPDHVTEVPARDALVGKDKDGHDIVLITAQAHVSGKWPDKLVHSREEELFHVEQGYRRPGKSDPAAAQSAKSAPHDPTRTHQEYPKAVGSQVVEAPAAVQKVGGGTEYPKWVKGLLVHSREEEARLGDSPVPPSLEQLAASNPVQEELERLRAENQRLQQVLAESAAPPEVAAPGERQAERAALAAEAEKRGIKVPGYWGVPKLKQVLAEAEAQPAVD